VKDEWHACANEEQVKYKKKMAEYEIGKERAAESDKKSEPECLQKEAAEVAGRKGNDGITKKVAAVESATENCDGMLC
jgi:hypothetical protein